MNPRWLLAASLIFITLPINLLAQSANTVGQIDDPYLLLGGFNLTARFFYGSNDTTQSTMTITQPDDTTRIITTFGNINESQKINALGDLQVLYYDYYAPYITNSVLNTITLIFIHGGATQAGYANKRCKEYVFEQFLQYGIHVISIEYRRGWYNRSGSASEQEYYYISEFIKLSMAKELAIEDVQNAWKHYNTFGQTLTSSQSRYIIMGESAGGQLVTRNIFEKDTYPGDNIQVLGAIIGFSAITEAEQILTAHNDVPVIIACSLFDETVPFGPRSYETIDTDEFGNTFTITNIGCLNFYKSLISYNYSARLLVSAYGGHTWRQFGQLTSTSDLGIQYCPSALAPNFITNIDTYNIDYTSINLIQHIVNMPSAYALNFFYKQFTATNNNNIVPNYQHWRFGFGSEYVKITNGSGTPLLITANKDGYTYPDINDINGDNIYSNTIGNKEVLTIDPTLVGLDLENHIEINGHNYGCDIENGLGYLNTLESFRYEPLLTEVENGNLTFQQIFVKYNILDYGNPVYSYENSNYYNKSCSEYDTTDGSGSGSGSGGQLVDNEDSTFATMATDDTSESNNNNDSVSTTNTIIIICICIIIILIIIIIFGIWKYSKQNKKNINVNSGVVTMGNVNTSKTTDQETAIRDKDMFNDNMQDPEEGVRPTTATR